MATKRLKAGDKVMIIGPTILGRVLREGTIGFLEEYDSEDETWFVVKKLNRPDLSGLAWFKRKNIQPVDEAAPAPKKTSSTKELTVDEKFIKEVHKAACADWKKKLEVKIPMRIFAKLTMDEMFELCDIISAVNLSGWQEGKKTALKTFAIDVAKVLYPEDYVS